MLEKLVVSESGESGDFQQSWGPFLADTCHTEFAMFGVIRGYPDFQKLPGMPCRIPKSDTRIFLSFLHIDPYCP